MGNTDANTIGTILANFWDGNKGLITIVAICLLLGFIGITAYLMNREAKGIMQEIPYDDSCIISLEGTYSVLSEGPVSMGSIRAGDEPGHYSLEILSDYEPKTIDLVRTSESEFSCEELGCGKITYKASSNSVKITFTKNGQTLCVLTK